MSGVSNTRRIRSLLNAAKEDQGLTLDKVVHQSEGRLGRSTAGNLLKDLWRKSPLTREELYDIAAGFGVDFEVLKYAHLMDMDLLPAEETRSLPTVMLDLPPGTDRLTVKQRAALSAVVRAMLNPEPESDTTDENRAEIVAELEAEADVVAAETKNLGRNRRN